MVFEGEGEEVEGAPLSPSLSPSPPPASLSLSHSLSHLRVRVLGDLPVIRGQQVVRQLDDLDLGVLDDAGVDLWGEEKKGEG